MSVQRIRNHFLVSYNAFFQCTVLTNTKQKKKSNGKSKRRESLSPVIAPSSPIDATDNAQNRSIRGVPRITTTSVTAKNIRHRTVSSSNITTIVNKKSIVSTTAAISKRQTVKTMCHIISYPWHVFLSFRFVSFLFFSFPFLTKEKTFLDFSLVVFLFHHIYICIVFL